MFELSVARKYLTPRWRQLSVSIISLISMVVIALVVWLIVVFFSVTYGLEKSWIDKLISLTAPIRVTPTTAYYNSYYYLVDQISENSQYTSKTLGEKLQSEVTDPYDPHHDEEIPSSWPKPDLDSEGRLKDLAKLAFLLIESLKQEFPSLTAHDYEMTASNLRLNLLRKLPIDSPSGPSSQYAESTLTQAAYLGSYDPSNLALSRTIRSPSGQDLSNLLQMIEIAPVNESESLIEASSEMKTDHLNAFFSNINDGDIQKKKLNSHASLDSLALSKAAIVKDFASPPSHPPLWPYSLHSQLVLPVDHYLGDGILLPRSFQNAGVLIGDRGTLSYMAPTATSIQEQMLPVYVAGFYDPGIIAIGGRFILANQELVNLIRSSHHQEDTSFSNGINVRFDDLQQADALKTQLQKRFQEAGISPYWKIETYREFDFTRDIIQQLGSEKNLFSLLAAIIIIVACSNIVSMLIILVNDKKLEIGIMRSMGVSSFSIALIFGACGIFMGFAGSLAGVLAAYITLQNLQVIINFISRLQGHELFNPLFYGDSLPTELSMKTLGFVMVATAIVSLVAGLIPAIKASMMRPSSILRSE